MSKIACIDFLDMSASLGGEHIYATVHIGNQTFRNLQYTLDSYYASKFNKKEEVRGCLGRYKVGDKSERFWSEVHAINHCIEFVRKNFPEVRLILVGDELNPSRVVWCADKEIWKVLGACYNVLKEMYKTTHDPFAHFPKETKKLWALWDEWIKKL